MAYDKNNIFARLLRGEVSCKKVYEDRYVLAFHDINPKAPVHALVIPKGAYQNASEFTSNASDEEIAAFYRSINKIIKEYLHIEDSGYRLISNQGEDGMQEVPHYHVHILGGKSLGPLLTSTE